VVYVNPSHFQPQLWLTHSASELYPSHYHCTLNNGLHQHSRFRIQTRTHYAGSGKNVERGRKHSATMVLFAEMRTKRGEWTQTIDKTKAAPWKAFLNTPSSGYLWKAITYMELKHKYPKIPLLKAGDHKAVEINENVLKSEWINRQNLILVGAAVVSRHNDQLSISHRNLNGHYIRRKRTLHFILVWVAVSLCHYGSQGRQLK
jgi:hypothetical protein